MEPATTSPPTAEAQRQPQLLETYARFGAVVAVLLYGIGFLVVSDRDALIGVTDFGLLRPRILAAGILFAGFASLPALVVVNVWGLGRVKPMEVFLAQPWKNFEESMKRPYRFVWWGIRMSVAYYSCFYGAVVMSGFCRTPVRSIFSGWATLVLVVIWAAFGLAILVALHYFAAAPTRCAVLVAIAATLATQAQLRYTTGAFQSRFLYLYTVALTLAYFRREATPNWQFFRLSSWFAALTVVCLIWLFAVWAYPDIKREWGGGSPTSVVLQFDGRSPIDNSEREHVWLAEETDTGYYIMLSEFDRKAVFVPRRLVKAVYFGE